MDFCQIILVQGARFVFNTYEPEGPGSSERQMHNDNPIYLDLRKETV